jgi:nitrogen fixation protein
MWRYAAFILLLLESCGTRGFRIVGEYEAPAGGYRFLAKSVGVIHGWGEVAGETDASLEVEIWRKDFGELIVQRERGNGRTTYVVKKDLKELVRSEKFEDAVRRSFVAVGVTLPDEELIEAMRTMQSVAKGPKAVVGEGQSKLLRVLWVQAD